jgi:transposase, IS5 family
LGLARRRDLYSDKGRPGIETRFVIGLLLLKHIFALSDEEVCERWVYDPYFQYFTGEEFLPTRLSARALRPEPLEETPRREARASAAESRWVAHEAGALRTRDLKRVTVDTTVQPKASRFRPTPSCCMPRSRGSIASPAGTEYDCDSPICASPSDDGGALRPRQAVQPASPLGAPPAHSARADHRDIRRKIAGKADLEALFEWPLTRANQIRSQQQRQRDWKLHSFHAPEVECIGKGKASAPYEFGVKSSIATHQCPRARRPVRAARQNVAGQPL